MNLCSPARVMLIILTKGVYTNQLSRWHSVWESAAFVCSDSAAVNGDAHRLSHMISLVTDVVRARLLALFSYCRSRSHRRMFFMMTDAVRCTLSFITFPFKNHFTHRHSEMHIRTQYAHYIQKHVPASLLSLVFFPRS